MSQNIMKRIVGSYVGIKVDRYDYPITNCEKLNFVGFCDMFHIVNAIK